MAHRRSPDRPTAASKRISCHIIYCFLLVCHLSHIHTSTAAPRLPYCITPHPHLIYPLTYIPNPGSAVLDALRLPCLLLSLCVSLCLLCLCFGNPRMYYSIQVCLHRLRRYNGITSTRGRLKPVRDVGVCWRFNFEQRASMYCDISLL